MQLIEEIFEAIDKLVDNLAGRRRNTRSTRSDTICLGLLLSQMERKKLTKGSRPVKPFHGTSVVGLLNAFQEMARKGEALFDSFATTKTRQHLSSLTVLCYGALWDMVQYMESAHSWKGKSIYEDVTEWDDESSITQGWI